MQLRKNSKFQENWVGTVPWIVLLTALSAGFISTQVWHPDLIADEGFHVPQIQAFINGDWTPRGNLAMYPTFHAMAAV
ncbi:MAG: hypothetical protein AAF242_17415, partial [Bacteroidota bacterium]